MRAIENNFTFCEIIAIDGYIIYVLSEINCIGIQFSIMITSDNVF